MKKVAVFLIALSLFTSCSETPEVSITPSTFNESNLTECQTSSCPKISIDYPVFSGDSSITGSINRHISDFILQSLYLGEGNNPNAKTIEEAASKFVAANRDLKTEFDMDLNYEASIGVTESFRNETLVSLEKRSYLYTGGAHGYQSVSFVHFDLQTGQEIATASLFTNFSEFVPLAEQLFRQQQNIPAQGSINATGYWFENDSFNLPESVGITEEGILLVYNQYDIASYADGPIEIHIPWDRVQPFLSTIYFP